MIGAKREFKYRHKQRCQREQQLRRPVLERKIRNGSQHTFRRDDFLKFDDVDMVQGFQDFDFADCCDGEAVLLLLSIDALERDNFVRFLVLANENTPSHESPLSTAAPLTPHVRHVSQ